MPTLEENSGAGGFTANPNRELHRVSSYRLRVGCRGKCDLWNRGASHDRQPTQTPELKMADDWRELEVHPRNEYSASPLTSEDQ